MTSLPGDDVEGDVSGMVEVYERDLLMAEREGVI